MDKNNIIELLILPEEAQEKLKEAVRKKRVNRGLTQKGLALRSGVKLATLRKFEQKGSISLKSFLKLLMVLDDLEKLVNTMSKEEEFFSSIEEVLKESSKKKKKKAKRGWRI